MSEFKYEINKLISMSHDEYLQAPGLNATGIVDLLRSPKHFQARKTDNYKSTNAMKLGTLVHGLILEGHDFINKYTVQPTFTGYTKKGELSERSSEALEKKAAWIEEQSRLGNLICTQEEKETAEKIKDSWYSHPLSKIFQKNIACEQVLFWIDKDTGVLCKARFDLFVTEEISNEAFSIPKGVCLDIKTTEDARAFHFIKSIFQYHYDIQAAHYLDGIKQARLGDGENFLWLAIEKDAPFEMECHTMDSSYFEDARTICNKMKLRYKTCLENNEWPGYNKQVRSLHFLNWMQEERTRLVETL